MKKDIEWLKEEIWRQDIVMDKGYIYTDDLMSIISEVDEPEVLSQEWIDENKSSWTKLKIDGYYIPVEKLQNLLVPKLELPVIPQFVAEWIESRKNNYPFDVIGVYLRMNESFANEQTREVLSWIHESELNRGSFARAWLDGFTVEEEQKYYALIKGHENIGSDDKYWNYCITDESLDIGDNKVHADVLAEYVLSATKDEWENLGIDDDNADFVEVEELEE